MEEITPALSPPRDDRWALGLTALFFAVCVVAALRHDMWRDELQAWLIARDSPSLAALFRNLKYEGHGGLWYVLLFGLTRVTHQPIAMQLLHVSLATAAVYTVARFAPFTKLQRALMVFGYFPLFEYGVISRDYGLGMLLTFLLCAAWRAKRRRPMVVALLLAGMAHTNVYSFIIAIAFSVAVVWRWVSCSLSPVSARSSSACGFAGLIRETASGNPAPLPATIRVSSATDITRETASGKPAGKKIEPRSYTAPIIVILAMLASIWLLIPPPDAGFVGPWHFWPRGEPSRLAAARQAMHQMAGSLGLIWKAYVPIPQFRRDFWNTNILPDTLSFLRPLLAAAFVVWAAIRLRGRPLALAFYALGTAGLLAFAYAKYAGYVRHSGALFVLLIASFWLAAEDAAHPGSQHTGRRSSKAFTALLGLHALLGLAAAGVGFVVPFSPSKQAAACIRAHGLASLPIVGHWDPTVSPLSAWLDRDIFLADSHRLGSFIRWDGSRADVTDEQTFALARELAQKNGGRVLVVLTPAPDGRAWVPPVPPLGAREVGVFTGGIVADEQYSIYVMDAPEENPKSEARNPKQIQISK